ncbi:MAG: hypothetical protein GXP63_04075 [DPANN group archaeon]|nr:hypothetical protein [DPANN group archaeon]
MQKKDLSALQKKHTLPSFGELDEEFEISSIDAKDHLLRAIRRKVEERLDHYAKIVEELLQCETTLVNLHECQDLDEAMKERFYELYRTFMGLVRESARISIRNDEKETAAYITKATKFWKAQKEKLEEVLLHMEHAWSKRRSLAEKFEYLG